MFTLTQAITRNKSITENTLIMGLLLLATLWQGSLQAQGVTMYTDRTPSAEEMGHILFSASTGTINTRSIKFVSQAEPVAPTQSQKQHNNQIGLPIKFAYNSAEILPQSRPFLDQVGEMLGMASYAQKNLVVEGHTDASGSGYYNQYLSEKRAQSVKNYLKIRHNIAGSRLIVYGKGEQQPLEGINPYDAVNRRVQFYSAL